MRKIFGLFIVLTLFLVAQLTGYAAPPVEGFMGVPWGADRQQVQKAMEERGFKLLEQRADGVVDTYQGTFVDQPAQLKFQYYKNGSVFYSGSAAFLHVKGRSPDSAMAYYYELKGLLTAKYGTRTALATDGSGRLEYASLWQGLPATATPSGQATIQLRHGPIIYGTGYWGNGLSEAYGVEVSYYMDSSWAHQKSVKDIKDL